MHLYHWFLSPLKSHNNFSIFHILTTVLKTHVRMEDHAKMVSLNIAVPANKDSLGIIVKQVCINIFAFISLIHFTSKIT